MSVEIFNRVSTFDQISNNFLCFVCSRNQAPNDFSNIFLTVNGIESTDVEKRKIVSVLCQLLHVKWDGVQELFIDNIHFPFCEKCSKSVIDIIRLREQLLGIELNLGEKIRKLETTIAHSLKSEDSEKMNKLDKENKKSYNDYRQIFQFDVLEEYLKKKLLGADVKQTIRSDTDLSLIQLHPSKNIFQIDAYSDDNMSIVEDSVAILSGSEELEVSDANIQSEVSPKALATIVKVEINSETPKGTECEYNFCLVTPPAEEVAQITNTMHNETDESLRIIETNRNDNSDDSRNDPDYVLPRKRSRFAATPKKQKTQQNQKTVPVSSTVENSNVGVIPEVENTNVRVVPEVENTNVRVVPEVENTNVGIVPEVETSIETLANENLAVRCTCGATNDSFILMCKFCGMKAHSQQKRLLYIVQADTPKSICPFCPAKFEVLNQLREHARSVHFPIPTPNKWMKRNNGDNFEEFEGEGDDTDNDMETLQRTGLCNAEEIIESDSEREAGAILSGLSSESSSSDEDNNVEKSTNATALVTPIHTTHLTSTSTKKGFMPGTKSVTTIGNTQVTEYFAKDRSVWTTLEPPKRKTRPYNILRQDGKLLGRAADAKLTPAEIFKLMISPDIVDLIVKYTNIFGHKYNPPTLPKNLQEKPIPTNLNPYDSKGPDDWKPTFAEEIYGYIGMILNFGLEKKTKIATSEAWSTSGKYTVPCIAATMTRGRFQNLSSCIRFDDWIARSSKLEQGLKIEKLFLVSEIFNPFVTNLLSYLRPYESLVVDELLVGYRGKAKVVVYENSKSGKIGMKIWACCDAKTGYILRLSIHESKRTEKMVEHGKNIVLELVGKYFGSGRNVTVNKFFTSKALALELIKQNMSLLGTLSKTRIDVIPQFTIGKGREIFTSIYAFQNDLTMMSYVANRNKSVVLLSTQHHIREVNPEARIKPTMILDYNKTKGTMNTVDMMISQYSCQRTTKRWPLKLFYAMCDIAALNAYTIWKIHQQKFGIKNIPTRLTFLRMVSEVLMEPLIRMRAQKRPCPSAQLAMKIINLPPNPPSTDTTTTPIRTVRRCEICVGSGRNTITSCEVCNKRICRPHNFKYSFCHECNPFAPGGPLDKTKGFCEPSYGLAAKGMEPIFSYQFVKDIASGKDSSNNEKQLRSRNYSVAAKTSPLSKSSTIVEKVQPKASRTAVKEDKPKDKTPVAWSSICRNIFPPGNSLGNVKEIDDNESEFEKYDLR